MTKEDCINGNKILNDIISMRDSILENTSGAGMNFYEDKYPYLYKHAPTMFRMVYENDFDYMPIVTVMLDKHRRIQEGEITHEDASKDLGESLAEKFIYPNIDLSKEPSLQDKNI